jgi:uncharacterized protein (TIGR00375 family)
VKVIADLHIHSKYSRATSTGMELETLSKWAKIKGIDILGTGDFTHPSWLAELSEKAIESEVGFLHYNGINFCLSSEVSCVFEHEGKTKKVHLVLLSPSLEIVRQINDLLSKKVDLKVDGRPTLPLSLQELCDIVFSTSEKNLIIPAHIWTPWFSIFGSVSGFNFIKDAFGEYAKNIYALETGLSSDPAMNWRVSQLDDYQLISNSDSHSPEKIGREANLFELETLSYDALYEAIKYKEKRKLILTFEFYPEEGKYHFDGHRACQIRFSPEETKKHNGICPVCRKKLTIGVLNRVEQLADRPAGFVPKNFTPFESLMPLKEVLAEVFGKNKTSKTINEEYFKLISLFGNEFSVFHADYLKLKEVGGQRLADAIKRISEGKVKKIPGYDGEYGQIKIFYEQDDEKENSKYKITKLTDF